MMNRIQFTVVIAYPFLVFDSKPCLLCVYAMSTTVLIKDLEQALTVAQDGKEKATINEFLSVARGGGYHDFKSKSACPKYCLDRTINNVLDAFNNSPLQGPLQTIKTNFQKGLYDDDPDEDDKKEMAALIDKHYG